MTVGGPIIDTQAGCVVGIIRGHSYAHGVSPSLGHPNKSNAKIQQKRAYGFGTPAEQLWSMYVILIEPVIQS